MPLAVESPSQQPIFQLRQADEVQGLPLRPITDSSLVAIPAGPPHHPPPTHLDSSSRGDFLESPPLSAELRDPNRAMALAVDFGPIGPSAKLIALFLAADPMAAIRRLPNAWGPDGNPPVGTG